MSFIRKLFNDKDSQKPPILTGFKIGKCYFYSPDYLRSMQIRAVKAEDIMSALHKASLAVRNAKTETIVIDSIPQSEGDKENEQL